MSSKASLEKVMKHQTGHDAHKSQAQTNSWQAGKLPAYLPGWLAGGLTRLVGRLAGKYFRRFLLSIGDWYCFFFVCFISGSAVFIGALFSSYLCRVQQCIAASMGHLRSLTRSRIAKQCPGRSSNRNSRSCIRNNLGSGSQR